MIHKWCPNCAAISQISLRILSLIASFHWYSYSSIFHHQTFPAPYGHVVVHLLNWINYSTRQFVFQHDECYKYNSWSLQHIILHTSIVCMIQCEALIKCILKHLYPLFSFVCCAYTFILSYSHGTNLQILLILILLKACLLC